MNSGDVGSTVTKKEVITPFLDSKGNYYTGYLDSLFSEERRTRTIPCGLNCSLNILNPHEQRYKKAGSREQARRH